MSQLAEIFKTGEESPPCSLTELPPGASALVVRLNEGDAIRRRLLDLGFVPGTRIKALRRSPLGDPTAYYIRGAVIALRREEARLVTVCRLSDKHQPQYKKNTSAQRFVVALAGNPNTGKSTLFNSLTGLRQHTGNWPGKTVLQAQGTFSHRDREFLLVDLPGTYSLLANSAEEETARDFILFAKPAATIVVTDATCLERNLNLALQVLEITPRVIIAVNLIDEARRKGLTVNLQALETELGAPVAAIAARTGEGLPQLLDLVHDVATGCLVAAPRPVRYPPAVEEAAADLARQLDQTLRSRFDPRWIALRLLDGDRSLVDAINRNTAPLYPDSKGVTIPVGKETSPSAL